MTRLTDTLLVQRVDQVLVVLDEANGTEIVVHGRDVPNLLAAIGYLFA